MIFIFLILFFTFPNIACGQKDISNSESKTDSNKQTKITEEEYETIRKQAQTEVGKRTRRVIRNEIRNIVGSTPVYVKFTQDFLPPDKSKWIVEEKRGNDTETTEIIYIGDFEYRKEHGKGWVARNLKSKSSDSGMGFSAKEKREENTKEFLEGEIDIDGATYRVLISKTVDQQNKVVSVNKMWIDKNGLIYKEESKSGIGTLENLLFFSTTDFDYTTKDVKIEAPIK